MKDKVNRKFWHAIVLLVCVGGLAFPLLASAYQGMVSANYAIPWSALSVGGQTMASDSFQMQSTLSRNVTGSATSDHYRTNAGYWPGLFALTERNVNRVTVRAFYAARAYIPFAIGAGGMVLGAVIAVRHIRKKLG